MGSKLIIFKCDWSTAFRRQRENIHYKSSGFVAFVLSVPILTQLCFNDECVTKYCQVIVRSVYFAFFNTVKYTMRGGDGNAVKRND